MRLFSALIFIFLLAGCPALPPTHAYQGSARRLDALLDATVALTSADGYTFCTGVLVEHQIVTAAHCVDNLAGAPQRVSFRWQREGLAWTGSYLYTVAHEDDVNDLAVLSPLDLEAPTGGVFLAPSAPLYGDKLVVIGHPLGLLWSVTDGRVSHPGRYFGEQHWMQMSANVSPGNSGGPVLNEYGELAGITSFRMNWGPGSEAHLSGAVHWDEISAALGGQGN